MIEDNEKSFFSPEEQEVIRRYHKAQYEKNKAKIMETQKKYRERDPLRYARQMLKTWQNKVDKLEAEERAAQQKEDTANV